MNYGPLSKKLALSLILLALPLSGQAQDNYTPPPMFGAPDPLPPVEPTLKSAIKQPPQAKTQTEKKVVEQAPIPPRKPAKKHANVKEKPKSRPGVVKGPKTMPAIPAKDYDSETLFENEEGQIEGAILKRHAETENKRTEEPKDEKAAALVPGSKLDIFSLQEGKAQKITLNYAAGNEVPSDPVVGKALGPQSLEILKENKGWRVQILSYASAHDQGQSSDRRMALNRALAVREAMLKSGVEPRLIDVRALGNKAQNGPKDRIDVIFYAQDAAL